MHSCCVAVDKMDDSEPTRKSGRKRKANKKYSIDAFEGLDLLSTDSEAGAGAQAEEDPGDDEEFAIETVADAAETPEEDDLSVVEGSEASDGSAVATPVEDDGDAMSIDSLGEPAEVIQGGLFSTPQRVGPYQTKASRKSQGVHIRGLPDPTQYAGKGDTLTYLFGTGTEELLNLVRSRDKWASDPTLPTREPNKHGAGGMCHSFSHTEEKRKMEATIGWDWYYNHGGRDKLAKRQKMRHLSLEEGHEYLPRPAKGSQSFLIGPYGKPSLYTLATGKAMSVGDAWKSVAEVSGEEGGGENSRKGRREGWILNIGRKIQCMDWAPNQSGGMQLLALSTPGSASEAQHGHPQAHGEPLKAPAYTASPPTPACIQIWAFSASTVAGREGWLDVSRTPKLQMVVCTEWGDAKQLKWCPMPRDLRDDDGDGNVTLGLLAGIWGDARVRVLDLRIERDWNSPTSYGQPSLLTLR